MFSFKKTALAVLALGSSTAFAGTMGPVCTPGNVTVPCASSAWGLGIQALYLRSTYGNNNNSAVNIGSASGTRIYQETDQDFEWGFRLEGSYHFNTGNDMNINWTHWRDNYGLVLAPTPGRVLLPDPTILTTTYATQYFRGSSLDAVNAEFGQHVDFGEHKNIRFHGSVQYARIETEFTVNSVTSGAPAPFEAFNGTTSVTDWYSFNGVGPRLGADMSYDFLNGFAIYGNAATALLVGNTKYHNNELFLSSDELNTRPVRSSYTGLVPELEAKMGATYTHSMAQGNVILDIGYMVTNYFNPLHRSDLDIDIGTEYRSSSDFGLHGPYAGLKWIGSI